MSHCTYIECTLVPARSADVYKRQVSINPTFNDFCVGTLSLLRYIKYPSSRIHREKRRGSIVTPVCLMSIATSPTWTELPTPHLPVSYTHLDVYKRQGTSAPLEKTARPLSWKQPASQSRPIPCSREPGPESAAAQAVCELLESAMFVKNRQLFWNGRVK